MRPASEHYLLTAMRLGAVYLGSEFNQTSGKLNGNLHVGFDAIRTADTAIKMEFDVDPGVKFCNAT